MAGTTGSVYGEVQVRLWLVQQALSPEKYRWGCGWYYRLCLRRSTGETVAGTTGSVSGEVQVRLWLVLQALSPEKYR